MCYRLPEPPVLTILSARTARDFDLQKLKIKGGHLVNFVFYCPAMMSHQGLQSFSHQSSRPRKGLDCGKSNRRNMNESYTGCDLEFIDTTATDAARLSTSWISLESSMEKANINEKQEKDLGKQKQSKVNLELSASKSDNSSRSDLYKLGYVMPDKETVSSSPSSQKFVSDSDDKGIVFVSSQSIDDSKSNDIVFIDEHMSRLQSYEMDTPSSYPNLQSLSNAMDSFCDLANDSGASEASTSSKISSKKVSPNFESYKVNSDDKFEISHYPSIYTDDSLLYLQNESVFNPEDPSKFSDQKSFVFESGTSDSEMQLNNRFMDRPVPQPPPEMGLPDLTKKQYFPKWNSEDNSESQSTDASVIVKNKVIGLWNNVKYGWSVSLSTNFSRSHPIVLLGNIYSAHPLNRNFNFSGDLVHINRSNSVSFQDAFLSITWLTYRTKLPPITINLTARAQESQPCKSGVKNSHPDVKQTPEHSSTQTIPSGELTSDCGWGCTLRCTQMMLCHALHKHFLGDDWVYTPDVTSIPMHVHSRIVRWFGDGTGKGGVCPLSLHQVLQCGYDRLGKVPGEWYSPSNAAAAIRDAVDAASQYMPDLERVTVYSVANNIIYIQDIVEQCWTPCICKMGKIAEYVKQQPPKQRSCCRSGSCDNALHASLRANPLLRPGNSASADMLSTSAETGDGFSSFVRIESISCDTGSSYSNRPSFRSALINGDTPGSGGRLHARGVFGRSLSVDESENYITALPRELPDSAGSETFLNESFCELDYPVTSPLASAPSTTMYSKPSMSQKLFGSYMPFKFGSKNSSNKSKSDYCSPVSVSTSSGKTRQESLQCDTIELLSPILEQERLCSDCHSWRSLVIILAVRLGGDSFNSIYEPVITGLLRHRLCIGMVGGKAKRAFYFVGYQEDQLLYLDPHISQDAVPCDWSQLPDLAGYHCDTPRKLPISRLEPSATLGFYCHTRVDFAQLVVDLHKITTVREGRLSYPLVEVKAGSRHQQESVWAEDSCILTDVVTLDTGPQARGGRLLDIGRASHQDEVLPQSGSRARNSPREIPTTKVSKPSSSKCDGFQILN